MEMEDRNSKINPWLSVWVRPRETTRYVIAHKPIWYIGFIMVIVGIFNILDRAVAKGIGDDMKPLWIIVFAIFIGPLVGLLSWAVGSGLSYMIGKLLGGTGTFKDLCYAIGVGNMIFLLGAIIWLPDLLFIGPDIFRSEVSDPSFFQLIWLLFSGVFNIVIAVWGFISSVFAVAAAHRFSGWRAFFTILIPILLLFGILLTIVFFLALFV